MRPGMPHNQKSPYATKADVAEIVTDAFENFTQMMKRSFDDVYVRFDTVDSRINEFKQETEQSLYELRTDMGHVKVRLGRVEEGLVVTNTKLDEVIDVVRGHETRITRLERHMT